MEGGGGGGRVEMEDVSGPGHTTRRVAVIGRGGGGVIVSGLHWHTPGRRHLGTADLDRSWYEILS